MLPSKMNGQLWIICINGRWRKFLSVNLNFWYSMRLGKPYAIAKYSNEMNTGFSKLTCGTGTKM
jgi:hypothetical protein